MSAPHRVVAIPLLVIAVCVVWPGVRPEAAPVSYTLVVDELHDLGVLYRFVSSEAHAINENGAIAGSGENEFGTRRAMFWATPESSPVSLGHLGGGWSEAWGINDAAVVVGNTRATSAEESRAFKWTQNGGMIDLGLTGFTPSGRSEPTTFSRAHDINNNGAIVGDLGNSFGTSGFWLSWSFALVPSCPTFVLTARTEAINDNDTFTGNLFCSQGPYGAPYVGSLWSTTILPGGDTSSDAGYAINDNGVAVGSVLAYPSSGGAAHHAFRYHSSTGLKDIHSPDDGVSSVARGINDNGLIVGYRYVPNQTSKRAFVYSPGIKMRTLPGLCTFGSVTSNSAAYAVNDDGWVVGTSQTCAGPYHAALWKVRVVPVLPAGSQP
jgi:probable HAF family extracellular repeat protein